MALTVRSAEAEVGTGEPMAVQVWARSREANMPLVNTAAYSAPLGSTATALALVNGVATGEGLIEDHVTPPSTLRELRPTYTVEGLVDASIVTPGPAGIDERIWTQLAALSTL